jgi:enoyl-CoA hydratase/carnithine racemase
MAATRQAGRQSASIAATSRVGDVVEINRAMASMSPRTAFTGVPSGAVTDSGTPKNDRKYSEGVSRASSFSVVATPRACHGDRREAALAAWCEAGVMPALDRDGDVAILSLGDDENRFSPDRLAEVAALLDEVASLPPPVALVTTAEGRIFSNGLDLDWLGAHADQLTDYLRSVQSLLVRVLTLPMPTVAAIQGHAFAAGAMLTFAHDWRVMRADRGFLCLPEVDLGMPFTIGMDSLIRVALPPATALEAMTTGRRYGGVDAAAAGAVTRAVDADSVVAAAVELVGPLAAKAGPALGTIKGRMFAAQVAALTGPLGLTPGD